MPTSPARYARQRTRRHAGRQARVPPARLAADERGAIMLIGVMMGIFLSAMLFYVVGINEAALQRATMQDAADAIAFSAAVVHAKGMNLVVLVNIAMAALLSVLVALRMLETLATVAVGIALAAGPFGAPAAATFKALALKCEAHYKHVRPSIESGLRTANKAAHVVKRAMPIAASARAIDTGLSAYRPRVRAGAAVPEAWSLPVEDGDPALLCEQAGRFAAEVLSVPLSPLYAIPIIGDGLEAAFGEVLGTLAGAAPAWFCGVYDGPAPRYTRRQKRAYPELADDITCREGSGADATEACERAAEDIALAEPDPHSGDCQDDCGEGSPYHARATAARTQCRPGAQDRQADYRFQARTIERSYRLVRGQPVATGEPDRITRVVLRQTRSAPCGGGRTAVDDAWHLEPVRADGTHQPLCSGEARARVIRSGGTLVKRFVEVTHLFGCTAQVAVDITPKSSAGVGSQRGSKPAQSPLQLKGDVTHGGKPFQVRSIAIGRGVAALPERVMRAAARGDIDPTLQAARDHARIAFAQAEYHYDGPLDAKRAMWSMQWTARLRRVRLNSSTETDDAPGEREGAPGPVGTEGLLAQCEDQGACDGRTAAAVNDWIVH